MTEVTPHALHPRIRTYKPRRSRISQRQSAAFEHQAAFLLPLSNQPLDLAMTWGDGVPVILEIGFGTGMATAQMASAQPGTGLLAIDIHTPGVGDLLFRIGALPLTNVRVMEADAVTVLEQMIPTAALAGVRSYFPDPWPKSRHHKRRLIQPDVLSLVADRLVPGGYWHIATDWDEYANAIRACFASDTRWRGGVVDRPGQRPVTRYEGRALLEGRHITDLIYRAGGDDRMTA